jgi:SAM-dependent methyltransferase
VQRVPEPELMDDPAQAAAYASADFSEPDGLFMDWFERRFQRLPNRDRALDLGCGPGNIAIRFAERYPCWRSTPSAAPSPCWSGRTALARSSVQGRVRLVHASMPDAGLATGYDLVISNSLLHHLTQPAVLWGTIRRCAAPDAAVQVMDLLRPEHSSAAHALVTRYADTAPAVLRKDFSGLFARGLSHRGSAAATQRGRA